MDEARTAGEIDSVSDEEIAQLGSAEGPCVSIFMPTARSGPDTAQGPIRLRNLADRAATELHRDLVEDAVSAEILAPIRALENDAPFWRHQAEGLAVYSAPDSFHVFRVPRALAEEAAVSASFRLRPLLPSVSGDDGFHLLAISQKSVRLFDATRHSIAPVASDSIPGSLEEALSFEDPERQFQFRTAGGGAQFHGHGAGSELDKGELERFMRAIDKGVQAQIGDSTAPMVLACVGYYLPIYRSVTRYPRVLEHPVEGSPEHAGAAELHAAAVPLVDAVRARELEADLIRLREAGGGNATTATEEIVAGARDGRVDMLFVTAGSARWGRIDENTGEITTVTDPSAADEGLLDRAVVETMRHGGSVRVVEADAIGTDVAAAALLRY